jgi:hypothetical protein
MNGTQAMPKDITAAQGMPKAFPQYFDHRLIAAQTF